MCIRDSICGHYKGIDHRVREHIVTKEISIGNYVVSGGELPAAVLCDSIIRLVPGIIGDESSALSDTFQDNFFMKNKWGRGGRDVILATQQASLLPLATLSSITEPLILLSRVPLGYAPEAVKDIGVALGKQTYRSMQQIYRNLERSGRKISKRDDGRITRSSDLVDEEWQELYEAGLAMDQAVMERIEGLTGEGLQSDFARGFQKVFFELIFFTTKQSRGGLTFSFYSSSQGGHQNEINHGS